MVPCIIYEDNDLLVVNKPAGINTHASSPYASEGLYDWLRNRESRWASLAIIHRLDKQTSGVLAFAKTPEANRSLTQQFTARTVRKQYLFLTDRQIRQKVFTVKSCLARAGDKYVSRPIHAGGNVAESKFEVLGDYEPKGNQALQRAALSQGTESIDLRSCVLIAAEPLTGRTHQIRVHAAESGLPVLGDELYGGTAARRVYLHAAELTLQHFTAGQPHTLRASENFMAAGPLELRQALIAPELTNAFRIIHGASDAWPGWYVDRLGDFVLSQSEQALSDIPQRELARLLKICGLRGACHKVLRRQIRRTVPHEAGPQPVIGEASPEPFVVRENGFQFETNFREGYSVGLFLDQRDNRRRLLTGYIAPGFSHKASRVLNVFAYTCSFSVCAAKAGAETTSVDLSRKYLEWGKRNFILNKLDPAAHEFVYGDAVDWLRRFRKKNRQFDLILLDPPTFSQSKASGMFRAEKDFGKLVCLALPLLKNNGVLFASTNAATWRPEDFLRCIELAVKDSARKILLSHYSPQPPDFPISRAEPGYLKTVWLRIESR